MGTTADRIHDEACNGCTHGGYQHKDAPHMYGICSKVGEIHTDSQRWKHIDTVLVLAVFALYIAFYGCELPSHLRTFSLGLTNKLIHKRNNCQHYAT